MRKMTGELAPEEVNVLKLMCAGLTHKQIARKLFMSDRTSTSIRYSLGRKTGCTSTAQLGAWAAKQGIV